MSEGIACPPPTGAELLRGDSNNDGVFNALIDGIFTLNAGFVPGSPQPGCLDAADANNDGGFNALIDALFTFNFGFVPGAPPMPAPFPNCGFDDDNVLGCEVPPLICP